LGNAVTIRQHHEAFEAKAVGQRDLVIDMAPKSVPAIGT
jgi:hypothetical protein